MQFDDLDRTINEAAENHPYSYQEESWEKMKEMLDKELPEKKDRRRWIFFLTTLLVAGGITSVVLLNNANNQNNQLASSESNNITEHPIKDSALVVTNPSKKEESVSNTTEISKIPEKIYANTGNTGTKRIPVTKNKIIETNKESIPVNNNEVANVLNKQTEEPDNQSGLSQQIPGTQNDSNTSIEENKTVEKEIPVKNDPVTESIIPIQKNDQQKPKQSILHNLGFSFSAGPDISFAEVSSLGKTKLSYGAGVYYRISNKLALRSGFFASQKIYTAQPKDYNPPPNFWNYYPNLKEIDADCKVYEVPLILDYNFAIKERQNWFGSIGISSLFMKRETYNYLYKPTSSNQYIYYERSHYNENKHYFSILTLSGGYNRKISNSFSLRAEPYVKVPLNGIGYGKVKLVSTGVLLSVIVKPFASKNDSR